MTQHLQTDLQHQPIPSAWKWTFIATLLFAPLYLMIFNTGAEGRSTMEQFESASAANMIRQYADIGELNSDEETMTRFLNDSKWVEVGGSIYKANCASCHGNDGGGMIGPNLCDDSYKHVKQITDIIRVVREGVAGGAMPSWKERLGHPNDIVLVSVYVASLRGSNPAKPKAPDGTVIAAWPKSTPTK